MAAALRLLLRQHAPAPPSPMMRSLFAASYSKTAAAAAASLPAERGAPLPPPRLREVTPRKAPPTPKGEPRCCKTVPSTMTDSTKSLLDKLKDLGDSKKSLKDMEKNIEEHEEMIGKVLDDRAAGNALLRKKLDDRSKLLAKIRNKQDYSGEMDAMYCRLEDDYKKSWAVQEAKARFCHEQMEILSEKRDDYLTAMRRYHELERSTMEQVKVQKVAKVGAAIGLVGGLLLILAKIY